MNIQKSAIFLLLLLGCCGTGKKSTAAETDTSKIPSVMQYLVGKAPEYQTLVKALNAADLVETIEAASPITMFAPLNVAFTDLPFGTIEELLKPVYKDSLQHMLSNHIIAGTWSIEKLSQAIKEKGGELSLPTIDGIKMLVFTLEHGQVFLKNREGNKMPLDQPVICTNGLVFATSTLLSP